MTHLRLLMIAGLVLPLAIGDAAASPPPDRDRQAWRKGSPIAPVTPDDEVPWRSILARAEKAAGRPQKVIEILERNTLGLQNPPAEATERLAQAYLASARYDDAAATVEHGLRADPGSKTLQAAKTDLEFTVGKVRLEEGVFEEAKLHFKRVLSTAATTGPGRLLRDRVAAAYRQVARSIDATGDHNRAVELLKASLELDADNPQSIRLLGNVLRSAGRTKDAISFYELYMMYTPEDAEMAGELIGLHREVGDETKANLLIAKFPQAAEATPESTAPSGNAGPAGPPEPVGADFEGDLAAAQTDRAKAALHAGRARSAVAVKDYKTAIDHYRRALELDPGNHPVTMALAEALRLDRKPEPARRLYEDLLVVNERDHSARFQLAKMLAASGQPADALLHFKRLAIEPALDRETLIGTYNWLGICYAQLNDYAAAEDAWREVLRIDPRFANAHYNLGQIREKQHRLDDTIAAFERAVDFGERDPDFLRYVERLALAYGQAGRTQPAQTLWSKLAQLAPAGSPQAARARQYSSGPGTLAAASGTDLPAGPGEWRRPEAIERSKFPTVIPQVKEADCLQAADRAFREGLVDESIRQYSRAVTLNPSNGETYFKLGDLLHQKGEKAREKALFERMLSQKLSPEMEQAARFRLQGLDKR